MEDIDLFRFGQQFPNDEACLKLLEQIRWPDGVLCPHCGGTAIYRFKDGKLLKCAEKECRRQFSAKAGTIFTDTHIPLPKWFLAIYLLTIRKTGTSSVQLAKDLGITQKSAWLMLHRIRSLEGISDGARPLREKPYTIETTFIRAMRSIASAPKTDKPAK